MDGRGSIRLDPGGRLETRRARVDAAVLVND